LEAQLVLRVKKVKQGLIIELVIWKLTAPFPGCTHCFKYRLFCGSLETGIGLVRYDNERGKGDHKHVGVVELPYTFIGLETLVADFEKDVREVLQK